MKLIGYYGGDDTHAMSAWTSTDRDPDKMSRMPQLLYGLAQNGHETPFEKSSLHFLITVDQATHIHLLKHRIGVSVNAESARYKELKEDKTYLPEDWKTIELSEGHINPFFYDDEGEINDWYGVLKAFTEMGDHLYHQALKDLTPILGRQRAKESARFFKTMNSEITMDVMFNFRSFVHFYRLRADDHAQLEVRELARGMLNLIKEIPGQPFRHSINAFKL
jgi:thymidylate synthase (FAD)